MAQLYSNENFPHPVVEELRRLGHDVATVMEAGKAEQAVPDEDVLAFATAQGRAVLTINRKHFIALHRNSPDHAGIIVCTFDADFIDQANRIDAAIKASSDIIRHQRTTPSGQSSFVDLSGPVLHVVARLGNPASSMKALARRHFDETASVAGASGGGPV